jgi:hypothetical protein
MGKYRIHSASEDHDESAQRPCARGERCASANRNHEPALGPRTLCSADRGILHNTIERLPELYLELWMRLGTKGSSSDGPRVSGGGKTPPTPIRLDIEALMARMIDVLSGWEERVQVIANLNLDSIGRPRRHGVAMTTMCRTLAAHIDVLLALEPEAMNSHISEEKVAKLPENVVALIQLDGSAFVIEDLDGGDAANQILELQHAARSKLGHTPRHHDLLTPCWNPRCEQRMLRRWDGAAGLDDHVECRSCGDQYSGEQLQRLMVEEELAQQRRARKEAS